MSNTNLSSIPVEHQKRLLFEMVRIRTYEETIAHRYHENKMRCPTHLSTGQEGVPAVMSCLLTRQDLAVSTHRPHAHYLSKGGDGRRFIAELYGKATGCAAGKGGSMHLIDLSVGFKGSTAIVGNTIPVGVGLALAQKLDESQNLTCIYLGDAAVEEGCFYEAANFAALKKLPVLFACENNQYSVYTHLNNRQPNNRRIYEMIRGLGIESTLTNGNDVVAAYHVTKQAIESVRRGHGPQFVEYTTYRWREHCGPNFDNHIGYRTEKEFLEWQKRDPIETYRQTLLSTKLLTDDEYREMSSYAQREVDEAFRFAEESPFPDAREAFRHIYKEPT
jgi:TPP-dependent pyruvate/acetoin dehydrogenase alpha subunit